MVLVQYPFLSCIFGIFIGLVHGAPMACIISALYRAIPYSPGVDIATGLGIGQVHTFTMVLLTFSLLIVALSLD